MDAVVHDSAQEAQDLAGQVLVPYDERPDAVRVADLTDHLFTCGQELYDAISALPESGLSARAIGGMADWAYLVQTGPQGAEATGNWNYSRALARVVQTLVKAVHEHKPNAVLSPQIP